MTNDLKHVGVLGMHWGVHKSQSTSHPDHVVAKALKKKKLHELSNEELKKLTTRLQLEKQFKDLSKGNVSAGKKFLTDLATGILKDELKAGIATFSKSVAPQILKAIKDAVDKANH